MPRIAFYISSHGFGHAARQGALIAELHARGVAVEVHTAAPDKFFRFPGVDVYHDRFDIGIIQPDSLRIDVEASFQWYADWLMHQPEVIAREAEGLRARGVDLVVGDMPPVAFDIAEAAGIPGVAITHFTWDWVYEHYLPDFPQYAPIVDSIRASYGRATLALQLPFAHKFDMFPRVEPMSLLVNPVSQTREELRARFDVPDDHRVALLSMGGHGWGPGDIRRICQKQSWIFWVMPDLWEQVQTCANARLIPTEFESYHNLIAAADVLVGKAGGSTVTECIAHQTATIYTLRTNWRENDMLADALRMYANSLYIPQAEFEAGAWIDALDEIANRDFEWPRIATNGATRIADRLLEIVS